MKNTFLSLAAAAFLAAALAAFMPACGREKAPAAPPPSDSGVPPPAAVNDFTMENLVGEFPGLIRSADYAGQPQLVLFFLPDDESCAAAIPDWNAIQRDYAPRGFTILGVIPDPRPAIELRPLVAALSPVPGFPTGRADSAIIAAFGTPTALRVAPTAFLLDASGSVVRYYQGHTRPEWIREDLDALLSGAPLPDHAPAGVLPEDNAA